MIPVLVSAFASGKLGRVHATDPPELLELDEELLEDDELLDDELLDDELLDEDELLDDELLDDEELLLFCPPQAARLSSIAAR